MIPNTAGEGQSVKRCPALFFTVFVVLLAGCCTVFAEDLPIVNTIEVKGLKRIEEGAVKSKISQKVGEPLSTDKISEDIRAVFRMGYFDDVKIDVETLEGGIRLIYIVKEKPTIIRVEFQGNEELTDEKLKEKLTITVGSISDITLINDNAAKIQAFYEEEGFWLAKVTPVVNKLTENEVTLTYQIEEGSKVRIKNIIITGNKAITAGKIKKAMKTSEWGIFSFITSSGYYKKDIMNADIEAVRDLYYNNGYLKVAITDPEIKLTDDKKGMNITIGVSEGEQYKIASVSISGTRAIPEEEIRTRVSIAPNAVFSKEVLRRDIANITELYTQRGYALANVFPDIVPDETSRQVGISFKIEEGDLYRIGRIEITGNTKTRDKVIRREIRLDEGDIFNSALLKRSYERINNLNFFEGVDLSPKPRYEEKLLDIDIKVKERSTGFISVGGGYSSIDKFIGMVDITQGNLFGTGRFIKLRAELGGASAFVDLSYRDPWFLDKPISFTASIYNNEREYIDYTKRAKGIAFGFGKSFGEYWHSSASYNLEQAEIFDVDPFASSIVKDQIGTNVTSSVTFNIARDSRDSYLDPSRGNRNALTFTFAGIGGTNKFIKGLFDTAWFFPLGSTSFALRGRIGYSEGLFGEEVPLYERFYVGGIHTVRGLGFGEAGPRDITGDPIGGTSELIFNVEYIFPIVQELKLKGVVFFDAGNSYEGLESFGTLRYTTGFGFRWISPMGPIRVEWGYNLDKRPDEEQSRVEFTFGSFF